MFIPLFFFWQRAAPHAGNKCPARGTKRAVFSVFYDSTRRAKCQEKTRHLSAKTGLHI